MRRTLLLLLTSGAIAADLPPAADTYVVSQSPANFGSQGSLSVAPGTQTLLQFDLRGLAAGISSAQVSRANLRLYVNRATSPGQLDVALAGSGWTESAVNGLTAPVAGTAIASGIAVPSAGNYLTIDVTAAVRHWLDTPSANQGLLISASAASPASVAFDSKENTATSHPALLEVALSGPQGPAGPAGIQGPAGPEGSVTFTSLCSALGYTDSDLCLRSVSAMKLVFVSETIQTGDLGGLHSADTRCQSEATTAGLTGTFLAWLSDADTSPSQRFSQVGHYRATDRQNSLIAATYSELVTKGPRVPIVRTARGLFALDQIMFTGTSRTGVATHQDCHGWRSSDPTIKATVGSPSSWTDGFESSCGSRGRVYCFQQ